MRGLVYGPRVPVAKHVRVGRLRRFFVIIPKEVRRDGINPARFDLTQLFFPIHLRKARVMKLAANDKERLAIPREVIAVNAERVAQRVWPAQVQMAGEDGLAD